MTIIIPIVWRVSESDDSHRGIEYFFNKCIQQNSSNFQNIGITNEIIEKMSKILTAQLRDQKLKLFDSIGDSDIASKLLDYDESISEFFPDFKTSIFIPLNGSSGIILRVMDNFFLIIGKDLDVVNKINETIHKEFEKLNKTTKDFGLSLTEYISAESC